MGNQLSFPALGISLNIDRVAFSIGPVTVYWYGIIVVTGIILGYFYASYRSGEFDIKRDTLSDYVIYAVVGGIIGARIYYVAFSWDYYKLHPEKIIAVWEGGIAIYGGIIGAVIVILIMSKLYKQNPIDIMDCCAGGLVLGQAIGRWGNFVNIEAFGANTNSAFGMTSPVITDYLTRNMEKLALNGIIVDPMTPVHPTFLYESVWNFAAFVIIVLFTGKRKFKGEVTLLYFGLYGLGRSWIEGLRTDSLMWGSFRVSQVLAIILTVSSFALLFYMRKKAENKTLAKCLVIAPKGEIPEEVAEKLLNEEESEKASLTEDSQKDNLEKTNGFKAWENDENKEDKNEEK